MPATLSHEDILDRTLAERDEAEAMSRDLLEERQDLIGQLHECAIDEDRVRAIHHDDAGYCAECVVTQGLEWTVVDWPCPTIRALGAK